ncbi:MAG TPA: phage tail sheath family protein, partial [Haliangium sp.]|nr:phage tail sheath family protein [Haliangium sp.]
MEQQFRQGAFAGTKSSEAYFVKCNAETTTPDDEAAGIVNVLVGFAPRRPAEFVVVKLSQKLQSSGG